MSVTDEACESGGRTLAAFDFGGLRHPCPRLHHMFALTIAIRLTTIPLQNIDLTFSKCG